VTGGVGTLAAVTFWLLTEPSLVPASSLPAHTPDLANGRTLFRAGVCLGCHKPPDGAGVDPELPSGGAPFVTPVGTFYPQNLTPDVETGLGRWTAADFVNAMQGGVSPERTHYFPAFPYASYRSMATADVLDLFAFLKTLPAVRSSAVPPRMWFVRLARRGVGLWKRLEFRRPTHAPDPARGPSWNRGAYLVNAPGHCGECHTPKTWLMVADDRRRMMGGPHPGGEGKVPSLRGLLARKKYKDAADLTLALQNGETMGYEDLSSGGMARIQEQIAQLPEADVHAIAEYLLSLE
jgi:mono/diheme cytochrome c family protein